MALSFLGMGEEIDRLARSARDVASALNGLLRNHRELLRLEAREEIEASVRLAILLGGAIFAAVMLCAALTALILREAGEHQRTALLALTLAYGVAALAGALALLSRLRRHAARLAPLLEAAREAEKALLGAKSTEEPLPMSGSAPPSPDALRSDRQGPRNGRGRPACDETEGGPTDETVEGESCFWFGDRPR